jgi:hypothetical protein
MSNLNRSKLAPLSQLTRELSRRSYPRPQRQKLIQ